VTSFAFRDSASRSISVWPHRIHLLIDTSRPLDLRPNLQIKFPDADAWFKRRDGEFAEILVLDCIDILTSIGDADFDFYHKRAVTKVIDGNVPHWKSFKF
jgi:hypothetical protein